MPVTASLTIVPPPTTPSPHASSATISPAHYRTDSASASDSNASPSTSPTSTSPHQRPSPADNQPPGPSTDSPIATASVFSAAESTATDATLLSTPTTAVCVPPPFWSLPPASPERAPGSARPPRSPPRKNPTFLGRFGNGLFAGLAGNDAGRRRMSHDRGGANTADDEDADAGYDPDAAPAILMHDNERDDRDGRGAACWAKSVRIVSWTVVEGSVGNIGAFVVWTIQVETLKGAPMQIRKRYSEFDTFRQRLIQTFPRCIASVPALPPKTVIARFNTKFLEKRRAGLQHFLNCILLNPEFSASPIMNEFLFN
ncbi:hypothetical protein BROUX41_005513 [Berkeleyomyces rouxiae]|uniref:uncharacterized protein n=1 Tax=Berkeleyomyces rouxiae TaxID=2035830 RepID=UPI003B76E74D